MMMPRYHLSVNVNWPGLMRTLRWSIKHEFFVFRDHYEFLLQSLKLEKSDDVRIHFIACRESAAVIMAELEDYNSLRRFLGYKIATVSSMGLTLVDTFNSDFGGVNYV